jgi:hypothetical protein
LIVSAYQPYFAPFAGFFSKALHSNTVVLMDSVQFPRGTTWLNRNRFKNDQGTLWMTVPVWKKGLGFQKINEVRICREGRWPKKHLESLKTAYAKAPFFEDHLPFLEAVFTGIPERLVDLNMNIIGYLMKQLEISAELILLSELDMDAKEPHLSVEVCKKLGTSHFLALNGAQKHLDKTLFQEAGIDLRFISPRYPVYPQLWGGFIPNLSAFDLLFNCGPKAHRIISKGSRNYVKS